MTKNSIVSSRLLFALIAAVSLFAVAIPAHAQSPQYPGLEDGIDILKLYRDANPTTRAIYDDLVKRLPPDVREKVAKSNWAERAVKQTPAEIDSGVEKDFVLPTTNGLAVVEKDKFKRGADALINFVLDLPDLEPLVEKYRKIVPPENQAKVDELIKVLRKDAAERAKTAAKAGEDKSLSERAAEALGDAASTTKELLEKLQKEGAQAAATEAARKAIEKGTGRAAEIGLVKIQGATELIKAIDDFTKELRERIINGEAGEVDRAIAEWKQKYAEIVKRINEEIAAREAARDKLAAAPPGAGSAVAPTTGPGTTIQSPKAPAGTAAKGKDSKGKDCDPVLESKAAKDMRKDGFIPQKTVGDDVRLNPDCMPFGEAKKPSGDGMPAEPKKQKTAEKHPPKTDPGCEALNSNFERARSLYQAGSLAETEKLLGDLLKELGRAANAACRKDLATRVATGLERVRKLQEERRKLDDALKVCSTQYLPDYKRMRERLAEVKNPHPVFTKWIAELSRVETALVDARNLFQQGQAANRNHEPAKAKELFQKSRDRLAALGGDLSCKVAEAEKKHFEYEAVSASANAIKSCEMSGIRKVANAPAATSDAELTALQQSAAKILRAFDTFDSGKAAYSRGDIDDAARHLRQARVALGEVGTHGCRDLSRSIDDVLDTVNRLVEQQREAHAARADCRRNDIIRLQLDLAGAAHPAEKKILDYLSEADAACGYKREPPAQPALSNADICRSKFGNGYNPGPVGADGTFYCIPTKAIADAWCRENGKLPGLVAGAVRNDGTFNCYQTAAGRLATCKQQFGRGWRAGNPGRNGKYLCYPPRGRRTVQQHRQYPPSGGHDPATSAAVGAAFGAAIQMLGRSGGARIRSGGHHRE